MPTATGFTLIELMFTVVILGILAGIGFSTLANRWRSERLQDTSKTLVAWLEERRREGMTGEKATELGTGVCKITVDANAATFSAPQSPIGSTPNICSVSNSLELRKVTTNSANLTLTVEPGSVTPVVFSFRGTSPAKNSTDKYTEFKLQLENQSEARCVFISKPLGLIRQGIARPASSECSYNTLMRTY